jgi:hypothetical protein
LRLKLARKTNSLTHYAKGTPSRRHRAEARRTAPTEGRHPVSGSVSLPALGCFSPFPHGTGALSVTEEYLGLEGGPPIFRQDFSCPALLEDQGTPLPVPGCHRLWRAVPDASGSSPLATGLVRVRSPLLAESLLLSFPPATEMFQFAGFASHGYRLTVRSRFWRGVAPFGHPRLTGRSPLPSAFRSVPRPSSPLGTKASTRCPFRAAPAPSPKHAFRGQWSADSGQTTSRRPLPDRARARDRCANVSPADARASASSHTHAPGPATPKDGRRPDLLHGHDSLHDVKRQLTGVSGRWSDGHAPCRRPSPPFSRPLTPGNRPRSGGPGPS